jgi:hypothetical protein
MPEEVLFDRCIGSTELPPDGITHEIEQDSAQRNRLVFKRSKYPSGHGITYVRLG